MEKGLSFTLAMVYAVCKCVNEVEAFRYRFVDGKIALFDKIDTTFTYLNHETELFRVVSAIEQADMGIMQVSDRFHLLKRLTDAEKKFLCRLSGASFILPTEASHYENTQIAFQTMAYSYSCHMNHLNSNDSTLGLAPVPYLNFKACLMISGR